MRKIAAIVLFLLLITSCGNNQKAAVPETSPVLTASVSTKTKAAAQTPIITPTPISATQLPTTALLATVKSTPFPATPVPTLIPTQVPTPIPTATPFVPKSLSPSMNCGSSKKLLGTCLFINIFLSDPESTFTKDEKNLVLYNFKMAANYLEFQSKLYNQDLSIIYNKNDLIYNYTVNFTIPVEMDQSIWTYDVLSEIIFQYNLENVIGKYKTDNVGYIFHVNKIARSYAKPQLESYDRFYDNELCVLFTAARTETGDFVVESSSYAYVHEILHLFGAVDLYYPFDPDDKRILLAAEYFPNDVMRVYFFDYEFPDIGTVDAFLIGWEEHLVDEYLIFVAPPYW